MRYCCKKQIDIQKCIFYFIYIIFDGNIKETVLSFKVIHPQMK